MDFAVESLEKNWNEIITLAVDHWHETGRKHGQKFALSYTKFVHNERAGRLLMCTARVKGQMVGYSITGEGCYLLPAYRKGDNLSKFTKFAEGKREKNH